MDGGFLFHIEENFIKIWQKIDELMKHNKDTEMRKERTYTTDINTFHFSLFTTNTNCTQNL